MRSCCEFVPHRPFDVDGGLGCDMMPGRVRIGSYPHHVARSASGHHGPAFGIVLLLYLGRIGNMVRIPWESHPFDTDVIMILLSKVFSVFDVIICADIITGVR